MYRPVSFAIVLSRKKRDMYEYINSTWMHTCNTGDQEANGESGSTRESS
jgi:hypothetical protein